MLYYTVCVILKAVLLFAQFSSCEINTIAPDEQQHLCTFRRQSVASTCVYEPARLPVAA